MAPVLPGCSCTPWRLRPDACRQLILGTGTGDLAEPGGDSGVRRLRKPFNLRDLRAVGGEILAAGSPPPPPAATAAR
jgi:hypothetical protein